MVMRTFRKNTQFIWWTFFGLAVAVSIGMIAPNFGARRDLATAAAVVDGDPVSQQDYSRRLQARLEQERQRQGGDLAPADSNRIRRDTLNGLIDETLALGHAKTLGQTMSQDEFREAVLSDPSFKDQQGRFDQARYSRLLQMQAEQGLGWEDAEENFQRGMLLGKVRGFWASQAVLTPAEAAAAEARYNRQVKVQAAVWNLERLRSQVAISEDDLHDYYSRNKQTWAKPEQLKLRQILLRADFAASSATAKAKADQVLAKLKAGADFKALAAAENADDDARKAGGDLGWIGREDLRHPELASAVFGLKKGQMTGVIGTSEGFHILKVEDRKEGFEPTFANSRDKAAKELGGQRAARQAASLAAQTLDAVKQGKSLAEAAKAAKASLVTSGWFGRDSAKALADLGESLPFARQALALDKGQPLPAPVSTDKAVVVAVLVDEKAGSAPPKPEDAESRNRSAREDARARKGQALYDAWLAGLRKKAEITDQSGVLASK